tara:strand:- start:1416 stop:1832 length:417 start_codon:yes stop_codon:yes gene_type:complete
MPETTKTYANIEVLQGADYEMTITLDSATTNKTYVMMVRKDFTGATDFGGRNQTSPFRTEIYETDDTDYGKLTATDSGTVYTVKIKLYAAWTETLDDDFDGYWEIVEKDSSSYSRIAQGEFYINNSASRLASITGRSD